MMKSKHLACAILVAVFALLPAAHAAMVTLSFTGTVSDPVDYSGLGYVPNAIMQTGGSFTGMVSFNNSATASSSDATDAYYSGTDLDMSVDITVAGQYQYILSTPSSSDEIDLEGSGFDLFKRGPTVYTSFSPNPPFSHLDFELQTDTDVLSTLTGADVTLGSFPAAEVSDAQTSGAGYYYVGATITSVQGVPEPGMATVAVVALAGLLMRHRNS
jgi:hypothetical protein